MPFLNSFSFFPPALRCSKFTSFIILSTNANVAHVAPTLPLSKVDINSQVADSNAVSGTQVAGVGIDFGASSWSVAEYKTSCADNLNARWFRSVFSDDTKSFI